MRPYILFLSLAVIALSSCSTAYKTGQTPDDVYYSPTRPADEYVVVPQQDDRYYGGSEDYTDRYLRMRLADPYRWSALDDYYFNNPYAYNYYGSYGSWYSPWNSYWSWNSYYNPYYVSPIFIKNPVRFQAVPSRAIAFNPRSYIYTTPQNVNSKGRTYGSYYNGGNSNNGARYNNSNSSRNYNFPNSGSNNSNNSSRTYTPSNSTPTRSYTPSSSSSSSGSSGRSSSSSSSSSSTAPSRPPR